MSNKYLEKIAETSPDNKRSKTNTVLRTAVAGIGLNEARKSLSEIPGKMLGYHTIYHGTSRESASKIKETGFDPSKGGTAGSKYGFANHAENSRGYTHFSKDKGQPRTFAHIAETKKMIDPTSKEGLKATIKASLGFGGGEVLKTKVPHSVYEKAEVDLDSLNPFQPALHPEKQKALAFKIKDRIPHGVSSSKFLNKEHLRSYYSNGGKARALSSVKNLGVAGVGIGAAYLAAKPLLNKVTESIKTKQKA